MDSQLRCTSRERALQVKKNNLNGIDYIEVVPPKTPADLSLLLVFCFSSVVDNNSKPKVEAKNVRIEGGIRIKNIGVDWAQPLTLLSQLEQAELANEISGYQSGNVLVVRPTSNGDLSTYTLRLVDSQVPTMPLSGFDPVFSSGTFSFKVECPSDFDCAPKQTCPTPFVEEPAIDYMAKDYASFRQLMLDRLSLLMPEWKERNPADLGVALVELLAYVADQLSYFQDAVATEAYLGTARKRVSIRRHARLLDYQVHEGCNSRAWVAIKVNEDADKTLVPKGTRLITGRLDEPIVVREADFAQASARAVIFETMHNLVLYSCRNELQFYTWGEPECCLPRGATHATVFRENGLLDVRICSYEELKTNHPQEAALHLKDFLANEFGLGWLGKSGFKIVNDVITLSDGVNTVTIASEAGQGKATLTINGHEVEDLIIRDEKDDKGLYARCLRKGDVLIFQEVRSPMTEVTYSPKTGVVEDADPTHRHAVRLTNVVGSADELAEKDVLEVYWDVDDALPFPLCLHKVKVYDEKNPTSWTLEPVSVIHGNVVLSDHGYTKNTFPLKDPHYQEEYGYGQFTEDLGKTPPYGLFRPKLSEKNLTYSARFDREASATSAFNYDARDTLPNIKIFGENELWLPQQDLLSSFPFAPHFVVEVDNDGTAAVRFGDDELGRKPSPSTKQLKNGFFALYRVGNGRQGNVGRETITRIVNSPTFNGNGISWVRNPMEAKSGTDAEDMENVRQYAPQAFRTQERAVTEEDYAEVLQRHPGIQKAYAIFRWTGSWHTAFVAVDRLGEKPVDDAFKQEIVRYLEGFRLSGYDLEITDPVYVPLDISMKVCVAPNYFWNDVEKALLENFSNRILVSGEKGFFHPDNFTFGQTVYLSRIVEAALNVSGVASVKVDIFQRYGKLPSDELKNAKIEIAPSEIARLDNDIDFPENGRITFGQEANP